MYAWVLAFSAAWQAFAVGPFGTTKSGHTRALWAAKVPEPTWVEGTSATLSIAGFDGKTLTGEVELFAAAGLDPKQCAVEVVWDSRRKRGERLGQPTRVERAGTGLHATWTVAAEVTGAPQIFPVTAFVFCPIDAAHVQPPWGAAFTSIETMVAGPKGKAEFCSKLFHTRAEAGPVELDGHHTLDVLFVCGVLPRLRGRDLVDDCKGDVLIALDTLGKHTTAHAPPTGTALTDHELRYYLGGGVCSHVELEGFDPYPDDAWRAAVEHMGRRMLEAYSFDGRIQP